MTIRLNLGEYFDAFIEAQLASGRYADASELVRDALRLLETRERRFGALKLKTAIEQGIADAGRVHEADDVFDELLDELAAAPHFAAE